MSQNITKVTVTDFMGIGGTIELIPEGSMQIIAGPNGSGKSSFIHALEEIFSPLGTRMIPKPIHDGATEARVEVETTKARLVRVWKKDGPGELSAYALDGAKYPSGKAFVVESTGGIMFDPDEFVHLDEKKQRDQLLALVELPFDLDQITAKRKGFFDARTDKTREVKRLAAQLAGAAPVDPTVPTEEQSAAAILTELTAAQEHNTRLGGLFAAAASAQTSRENAASNVARLTDELDAARTFLSRALEAEKETLTAYKALELIDTDGFTARLSSVEETNAKVRAQKARTAITAELAERTAEDAALTASITAVDKQKADGLAAAKFPAGLSIDDVGIVKDGIPFRQLNSATQDIVALDLATSSDADLKVVVMKSGDRLDDIRLEAIRALAAERGFWVVVERDRGNSREVGFIASEAVSA